MKKTSYILILVVLMVSFAAGSAFARRPCFYALDRIEGINLSEDQKVKLDSIETENLKKMAKLQADFSIAKFEKNKLMREKNLRKNVIKENIKRMMAIKTDMEMGKLDIKGAIRSISTDEQWELFRNFFGKRGMGHYGKKGRGMGGPNHKGRHLRLGFGDTYSFDGEDAGQEMTENPEMN